MRKFIFTVLIGFCLFHVSAQVVQNVDQERLERFKAKLEQVQKDRNVRIEKYLQEHPSIQRVTKEGNDYLYLKDIQNGKPVYVSVYNTGAAATTNTTSLQSAADFGLQLTGEGIRVGVWDGGYNRNTHQEYAGRTIIGDGNEFGVSDHATHVMGTILASGVDPAAKGMAVGGRGISFGFGSDLQEMTAYATTTTNFLTISNHSYGVRAGWNDDGTQWLGDDEVSQSEDWRFGYYDSDAANTDELMYIAPYYLSIWAAGNQRGQSGNGPYPPNGPYDVLVGDKTAKNTLVVGAINKITGGYSQISDAQMSSFSCWGPTDDGRIKPDIVGAGVGIYSSTFGADDSYGFKQGTSMSTPNVTGSLMLIQELYGRLTAGNVPRSATMKAMVFHTANEAGTIGPDYVYGWGVLNTRGIADLLMTRNNVDKVVQELSLENGETFEMEFEPAANTEVKATIVWTDLPGEPGPTMTLDGTKLMLINDLDMRISEGSDEFEPWILNPENPGGAAQKGDNFRDNSEQVVFTSANDNVHTLSISHKGALQTGRQNFSIVLTYTPKTSSNTFYWVGEQGGDWDDVNNWSLTTGGASANAIPSANDYAIFDDNSFADQSSPVVSLTGNVDVASIKWLASEEATFALSDFTLSLTSGFIFDNENVTFGSGSIFLLENQSSENDLVLNGLDLSSVNLIVNSSSTQWRIIGESQLSTLNLLAGELDLSLANLTVGEFIKSGTSSAVIDLSNSTISINDLFDLSAGNVTLTDDDATYIIPEGETAQWNAEGFDISGDLNIAGDLTMFGEGNELASVLVEEQGGFTLQSSVQIQSLELQPGSGLAFESGVALTLPGTFIATGSSESLVSISGEQSDAGQIIMDGHRKLCLDFLQIENVTLSGEASVTAGVNSTSNNDSWPLVTCENLLYSDFDFAYTCLSSLTMFTDLSTGTINSWSWDFGDGSTSAEQNPSHEYMGVGTYTVRLEVSDDQETKIYEQELVVGESDLQPNTIVNNNGVLASVRVASAYQWYKDGELVPGATQRTFDSQEENGIYFVVTFSDGCNLKSSELEIIVTSIEDEEQELLNRATNIAPNPAEGIVEISMVNDLFGEIDVNVSTLNGADQINVVDNKLEKEYIRSINVGNLPSGVYIVKIAIENRIVTKKLLIK